MSVSTMVETCDMPMIDYNDDGDIPMAASSSENWFQPLSRMDEDAHQFDPLSDFQEVDMMAFEETTTEYEMADEAAQPQQTTLDANVIDAEVYDVAIHSSPLPPASAEMVQNHVVQSVSPGTNGTTIGQSRVEDGSHLTFTHNSESVAIQNFPPSDPTQFHDSLSAATNSRDPEHASDSGVPETNYEHRLDESEHTEVATLEPVPPSKDVANVVEKHFETPSDHPVAFVHSEGSDDPSYTGYDDRHPDLPTDNVSDQARANQESTASEHPENEEISQEVKTAEEENGYVDDNAVENLELHANQHSYTQPSPPIFLSLQVTSSEGDQPDFVLFALPDSSSHATEEPLLLLQHRPSLFYEPISAVFEAFRHEEYFSHIEELSEAEMVLNAHELQLVISEDNIYAREVSLHDLYAMHQGVGLPGHLRLILQSIVPRFIARYNHLRDQITRLVLTDDFHETSQHVANVLEREEGDETQAHTSADDAQQDVEHKHETEDSEAVGEHDGAEDADHLHDDDGRDAPHHSEEAAPEAEDDGNEVEQNVPPVVQEGTDQDQNEETLDDDADASGESDNEAYELDADALHPKTLEDGTEPSFEEHVTESDDVAEPREDGDEGYGDEFKEDGADDTGTAGNAAASTVVFEDDASKEFADEERQESVLVPDDVQPHTLSQSTSTSSFDENDSSWEDAIDDNDPEQDEEQETNQTIQQATATAFDEEGKITGAVEDGDEDEFDDDDLGDDDFENSAEGTLQDPAEEFEKLADDNDTSESGDMEKAADAASQAVLAESEKFVSSLDESNENSKTSKENTSSNDDVKSQTLDHSTTTDEVAKPKVVHKNLSKRSLDDAESDGEELVSPPSSPDSKRTRTL